ncbi:lytic transglycosylase domain-containing protein [Oricola thermophila]|uniref:Transglycosylase SLT domain-containing protein n=1 Tax=Oricola thermophila TaxID=2742145 RepID=A0A6N1VGT5_9HYPH|nr:lytic transglycosylase domain-containing protein [Oricola thermophila]QKV18492.1 transglycosylase SLT domain-containing protein [Oricola thermophila]
MLITRLLGIVGASIAALLILFPNVSTGIGDESPEISEHPQTELRNQSPDRVRPPDEGQLPEIAPPTGRSETLERALAALDEGDAETLRRLRSALPEGSLDYDILAWAAARTGNGIADAEEIEKAMARLEGWPDMARLRANHEAALAREMPEPSELVAAYGDRLPATFTGAVSLARALHHLGQDEKAREILAPWWHDEPLTGTTELAVLAEFSRVLKKEDHGRRFLAMMYRDRIRSAQRIADRAGMEEFLAPWSAAIRKRADAPKLLEKAPDAFKETPHHLFARIKWLRRMERDDEAAKLLLESPVDEAELVDPDAWWVERRIVSRDAFERGDAETAYKIAAMQRGGSDATRVEAAFHAGWYALRGLKDAKKAAGHFAQIEKIAKGGISRARGAYWLGRAHEAMGSAEAESHFRRAAGYPITYYGQLARHRLDMPLDGLRRPSITQDDTQRVRENRAIAAMHRLEEIGQTERARQFALALGRTLDNTEEITHIVAHWERNEDRHIALRIAKAAEWRGVETGALTHPIGAIPPTPGIAPEERPLAYAIARQESEFNVTARSRANALGLMQLLPGTAREVARQAGIKYEPARLVSDGAYNARLGTAYLRKQLERFDGSFILTFVAYNAGPSRALEWIERFGDPRGKPLEDVVDWVEQIPFGETRSYVQRVMENLQVYKARLGEHPDIGHDLRFGARDRTP